ETRHRHIQPLTDPGEGAQIHIHHDHGAVAAANLGRAHLDAEGFSDVNIQFLGGEPAGRTDPDDPFVKIVVETAEPVFETKMEIVPLIGGSGPNSPFIHELRLPIATAGLGYPDTRAHAPNENIRLDLYLKHARHMARVLKEFSIKD
ncbi:MAG: M20/M25/M40 family metallo-hydrolase, partial [Chloroflexi bacterium]